MEKRKIDKLGVEPSLLGFGCMRFPITEDGKINEPEAEKMLDYAIEKGVTYIDTAYPYHGGESEKFVGRALKKYNREDFYLATKLPVFLIEKKEDTEKFFNEQLEKLQVEYFDFYLLHALNKSRWEMVKELEVIEFCEEMKRQGKIKNFGFSFHDVYETFEEIIKGHDWDFCQIQYNYIDTEIQAGDKGYKLAEEMGVPVVIMEPIKGGQLAVLPEDIDSIFKEYDNTKSTASWAMRWVASKPGVMSVLSGMSTFEQVEDNVATFENFVPLNGKDAEITEKAATAIKARRRNGCTSCEYCLPCPFGVNIPKNFTFWNEGAMFRSDEAVVKRFKSMNGEEVWADKCQECGKCEPLCPQNINIREDLKKVAELLK